MGVSISNSKVEVARREHQQLPLTLWINLPAEEETVSWIAPLKERLLEGILHFDSLSFGLDRTAEQLRDMLGWLPLFPATKGLGTILVHGGSDVSRLERLALVVEVVFVSSNQNNLPLPSMKGMDVLRKLAECAHLGRYLLALLAAGPHCFWIDAALQQPEGR